MFPSPQIKAAWILGGLCLCSWVALAEDPQEAVADLEDLEDLVAALEEAGTAPTALELRDWQADLGGGDHPGGGERLALPGELATRVASSSAGFPRTRVTWQQKAGLLESRLRFESSVEGAGLVGGFLAWRSRSLEVVIGRVGSRFGHGLLWAGPGRSSSLSADHTLGTIRQGVRGRTGWPDQRTLEGGGAVWRTGPVEIQAVGGRWSLAELLPDRLALAVGARLAWEMNGVGCAYSQSALGNGFSVSGSWEGAFLQLSGEAARFDYAEPSGPATAALVVATVQPGPRWRIQAAMATSTGHRGWSWGLRPSLLRGDEGQAWAVRCQGPLSPSVKLALLVAGSESRDLTSAPRWDRQTSWDALVLVRPVPGWEGRGRIMIGGKTRNTWDSRFPWLVSVPELQEDRVLAQLTVRRRTSVRQWQAGLRVLDRSTSAGNGRRALWHLRGRWPLAPGFQASAGYGQAWGDNVDLVSALAPLPGLVVPRHWGQWESETHLGLVWRGPVLELRLAAARRRAADPAILSDRWEGWLEGLLSW